MQQTITDVSFGVVPFYEENGENKYLLIKHVNGQHWGFPKGHKDFEQESDKEAAIRELEEETNLTKIQIIEKSFVEKYSYLNRTVKVEKTVTYFPAKLDKEHANNVKVQEEEVLEFGWFNYLEAAKRITFPEGRRLLEETHQYLTAQN